MRSYIKKTINLEKYTGRLMWKDTIRDIYMKIQRKNYTERNTI